LFDLWCNENVVCGSAAFPGNEAWFAREEGGKMRKHLILAGLSSLVVALLVVACGGGGTDYSSSGGGGGGGSSCATGYCLNNGQCCPRAYPDYTYGGHGYAAGCYASCPYVGDCGSTTRCF
jgi:hypothetical protein